MNNKIRVGCQVSLNDLPNATWYDVVSIKDDVLWLKEHDQPSFGCGKWYVCQVRQPEEVKPWNLTQVSIDDRQVFNETLLSILDEGRKLTPMEVAKVREFMDGLMKEVKAVCGCQL